MNFDFSEDQKLLSDQVKRFLGDASPPLVVREALDLPLPMHLVKLEQN